MDSDIDLQATSITLANHELSVKATLLIKQAKEDMAREFFEAKQQIEALTEDSRKARYVS